VSLVGGKMILCTECYIQRCKPLDGQREDGQYGQTLMMYRNKKADDINQGKWVGIGGKFESGESPEQCLMREVQEETGLELTDYRLRGLVTFTTVDGSADPMLIFVYTADGFTGELAPCDEGTLQWVDNDKIDDLNLWQGDRLFWKWMQTDERLFSARFTYNEETLADYQVAFY